MTRRLDTCPEHGRSCVLVTDEDGIEHVSATKRSDAPDFDVPPLGPSMMTVPTWIRRTAVGSLAASLVAILLALTALVRG